MKNAFFVLLVAFITFTNAKAQTSKFYSTDFAYKTKSNYGYWSEWSDWEPSKCLITISLDRDVINIYSRVPQEFDIYEIVGEKEDESGSSYIVKCVDADGLRCHIRLRRQNNGVLQLYIEYNDIIYVYCLTEKN